MTSTNTHNNNNNNNKDNKNNNNNNTPKNNTTTTARTDNNSNRQTPQVPCGWDWPQNAIYIRNVGMAQRGQHAVLRLVLVRHGHRLISQVAHHLDRHELGELRHQLIAHAALEHQAKRALAEHGHDVELLEAGDHRHGLQDG